MKRLACVPLAFALVACGGGQTRLGVFSASHGDDSGEALVALRDNLANIPIRPGANVAIGITAEGIVGMPLAGGETWTFPHALDSRPTITGSVVVGMGGGELFAIAAESGELLWSRRAGGALRAAGDDGRTTVVSLASTGEYATTILAISHDGRVLRQLEAEPAIGKPAVVGKYAFFPWEERSITVYDLTNGAEVARLRLSRQTSRAFTLGGALFFGEEAVTRFDEPSSFVLPPARALPGSPKWLGSSQSVVPVHADARDKIRVHARPTSVGPLDIEGRSFVATYYQLAIGLDKESGATLWARTMPHEILGGAAFVGGVALCDASGGVTFLDQETGAIAGAISLGVRVKACVVQADDFTRAGAFEKGNLVRELATAIQASEPELIAMQKELLRELGSLDDESVTQALIEIASSQATPKALLADARALLAARRNGATYMLEALEQHYDYLQSVRNLPPTGALAEALAAMNERRAAPLLAEHLLDPANSSADVEQVAVALVTLASTQQLPQLQSFFALYRATADDEALVRAVGSVARAIVDIGGAEGRALVQKGITDPTTVLEVREELAALLDRHEGRAAR